MKKLVWIAEHIVVPGIVSVVVLVVGYYNDLGGVRSTRVTNAIQEIETAVQAAYDRCGPILAPGVRDELIQAEDYKWDAIEARDNRQFREAYSNVRLARECIQRARERGCPEIYVPRPKPWREQWY